MNLHQQPAHLVDRLVLIELSIGQLTVLQQLLVLLLALIELVYLILQLLLLRLHRSHFGGGCGWIRWIGWIDSLEFGRMTANRVEFAAIRKRN